MRLKAQLETEEHGTLTVTGTHICPPWPALERIEDVEVTLENGAGIDLSGAEMDRAREALWKELENQ
jgi:hypothetical protein